MDARPDRAIRNRRGTSARLFTAGTLAASFLLVAASHATASTISSPTPASLAQNRPVFTITNTGSCGPGGTKANWFYLSRTSSRLPQVENGITFLTSLQNTSESMGGRSTGFDSGQSIPGGVFDFTPPGPALIAGRYFFQVSYWNVAPQTVSWSCGLTSGQPGGYNPRYSSWIPFYTDVQSFTLPVQLRAPRITTLYQHPKLPQTNVLGRITTNSGSYRAVCRVFNGKKQVGRTATGNDFLAAPAAAAKWSCYDLRVPESLDGKRLTLKVVITAGTKKVTVTRPFVAR